MVDVFGPLVGVELATWLWLVVLLPLLAFAGAAYIVRSATAATAAEARSRATLLGRIALAASGALLVGLRWGHGGTELDHVFRFFRVGRFDVSFDLAQDGVSTIAGVGIVVAALLVAFSRAPRDAREADALVVWLPLSTAGALVTALADNAPTALIGAVVASVAGFAIGGRPGPFHAARVADAFTLVSAVVLAWSLGGGFAAGSFVSDMNPRMAIASQSEEAALAATSGFSAADDDDERPASGAARRKPPKVIDLKAGGKGSLTITGLAGSLVYLDDNKTPLLGPEQTPLRTPIVRHPIPTGLHTVRVRPGDGVDDTVLSQMAAIAGEEQRIVLVGPTLSPREAQEQLGMKVLSDKRELRTEWAAREAAPGTSLVAIAAACLAIGLLARSFATGASDAAFSLVPASLGAWAMLAFAARLTFVWTAAPDIAGDLAVLSALVALAFAARAARASSPAAMLPPLAIAKSALVLVGLASGAAGAAVLDLAVAVVALTALGRVARMKGELASTVGAARAPSPWSLVWLLASASLALGFAQATELACAFALGGARGGAAFAVALIASGVVAYALVRVYALSVAPTSQKKPDPATREMQAWTFALLVALLAALALGFDSRVFDGDGSFATRIAASTVVAPAAAERGQGGVLAITVVWLGVALGGASIASRRYSPLKSARELERRSAAEPTLSFFARFAEGLIAVPTIVGHWLDRASSPATAAPAEPAPSAELLRGVLFATAALAVTALALVLGAAR